MIDLTFILPVIIFIMIFLVSVLLFVFIVNFYDLTYYKLLLIDSREEVTYSFEITLPLIEKIKIESKLKLKEGDIFKKVSNERILNEFFR